MGTHMSDLTPEERRRIYHEEKARIESEGLALLSEEKRPFLSQRLVFFAFGTLLIVAVLGTLGYHLYRAHEIKQRLAEAIGRDLGLTETILKVETESSKITFGEVFQLCSKSVEDRTNLIVELRGLHPEMDSQLKTRLLDYLNAENEFVRAKRDLYRKSMEHSAAFSAYMEQMKSFPSSSYGLDFYNDRIRQSKSRVHETADETEQSANEFLEVYEKMVKQELTMAEEAQGAGIRFERIFLKHAKANKEQAELSKIGAGFAKGVTK